MEKHAIFDEYAKGRNPLPEFYVESYLCPSDSSKNRYGSVCSYAANGGWAAPARRQRPANGPFINRVYDPKAGVMEGHWKDGRDHTLVFAESLTVGSYHQMGWGGLLADANDESKDPVDRNVTEQGQDRLWGPVFVWQSLPEPAVLINGPSVECMDACSMVPGTGRYVGSSCTEKCNVDRAKNAKPSSEHGGGVNVTFGSGRALFLRETIDYKIFRALMTLSDKTSDSPERNIILDDLAYQ
jgi:hypothetical protein